VKVGLNYLEVCQQVVQLQKVVLLLLTHHQDKWALALDIQRSDGTLLVRFGFLKCCFDVYAKRLEDVRLILSNLVLIPQWRYI
jgi:hypothetical protein